VQILLVRHGIAEDPEAGSPKPDSGRQLTKKGRKQMKLVARGMRRIVGKVNMVACSPYTRAVQTAEILLKEFRKKGDPEFLIVDEIRSGVSPEDATDWLARQDPDATLVLVGHEPDFSELMSHLTSGGHGAYARFSKAGACLISFGATPSAGNGDLIWLLTPDVFGWLGV